ncbi:MAG: hypothetical protein LBL66_02105 [Clostridiales bacterium]|jgi:hypothetical protein|nr:hypothetical protein [Clostridiales bacterium]
MKKLLLILLALAALGGAAYGGYALRGYLSRDGGRSGGNAVTVGNPAGVSAGGSFGNAIIMPGGDPVCAEFTVGLSAGGGAAFDLRITGIRFAKPGNAELGAPELAAALDCWSYRVGDEDAWLPLAEGAVMASPAEDGGRYTLYLRVSGELDTAFAGYTLSFSVALNQI